MKYSILKEEKPVNTVNRIQNILQQMNICVREKHIINTRKGKTIPIVSVRLDITNPACGGTNGKGTSLENARASAYGEMMERLQNFALPSSMSLLLSKLPDRIVDTDNLKICRYENNVLDFNGKNEYFDKHKSDILNKNVFVPFYSIKNKSLCAMPVDIIYSETGSNGMAAGNTLKEAIVQGLSEICERYVCKKTFLEKIALPSIPEEEYLKYENLNTVITYIRENGFNIFIKDASLGGKLPVICTVLEKDGIWEMKFAANPSFPVAIERTLTETGQGVNFSNYTKDVNYLSCFYFSKPKFEVSNIEDVFETFTQGKTLFEYNDFFEHCFFNLKSDYKYSKKAFFNCGSKEYSNDILLDFLIKEVSFFAKDIYIRNVSFMNFPSVFIYVPEMSKIQPYSAKRAEKENNLRNWNNFKNFGNYDKKLYTAETLLDLAEYVLPKKINPPDLVRINLQVEYIAFLCSVLLKNTKKIKTYHKVMLAQNKRFNDYSQEQLLMFDVIDDYFTLSETTKDEKQIENELKKTYSKKDVKSNINLIHNLDFDSVLHLAFGRNKYNQPAKKRFEKHLLNVLKHNPPKQGDLKFELESFSEHFL